MTCNTTRVDPRTLAQAFPDERAHCIEGPERRQSGAVSLAIAALVVLILALIAVNSSGVLK